jgi:hypothetical protein
VTGPTGYEDKHSIKCLAQGDDDDDDDDDDDRT